MRWYHEVNLEWLKDRQHHLTASDIKKLLPITSTGKDRKVKPIDYLKVWASKQKQLTQEDCIATGAAARGHILEPYAIEARNELLEEDQPPLYHWDDCLIVNVGKILAYSPDALSVFKDAELMQATMLPTTAAGTPKIVGEVKCYSPERFIEVAVAPKERIEERWQIATAMAVSTSIEEGELILYDPSAKYLNLVIRRWTRDELRFEIKTVEEIADRYEKTCSFLRVINDIEDVEGICGTGLSKMEEDIIRSLELNPR